ncbi:MAG: hypothetical protein WDO73_35535 [Ignavibacteriota bacterium]
MISSTLVARGNDLERAASRRAYADVERLSQKVGAAAVAEARSAGVAEIAAWLKDLFDRTEILLRIARAAHAEDLHQLALLKRYLSQADQRAEHLRLAL